MGQIKTAAQIRVALLEAIEAYNAGDAEGIAASVLADWVPLGLKHQQMRVDQLKAAFAAGCRFGLKWEWLYVRLYGDNDQIAIASGELSGRIRLPEALTLEGPWRYYRLWLRQGEEWRLSEGGQGMAAVEF